MIGNLVDVYNGLFNYCSPIWTLLYLCLTAVYLIYFDGFSQF